MVPYRATKHLSCRSMVFNWRSRLYRVIHHSCCRTHCLEPWRPWSMWIVSHVIWSKHLKCEIPMHLSQRGLFLLDLNDLAKRNTVCQQAPVADTHIATEQVPEKKNSSDTCSKTDCSQAQDTAIPVSTNHCKIHSINSVTEVNSHNPVNDVPSSEQSQTCLNADDVNRSRSKQSAVSIARPCCDHVGHRAAPPQLQAPSEDPLPALPVMSLEQMELQVVNFGQAHRGKTYATVWNTDQSWVTWFASKYHKSTKMEHRMMMRYIQCKLDRAELQGERIPMSQSSSQVPPLHATPKIYPSAAKAKAKSSMSNPYGNFRLEERMNRLENALQGITQHLEALTIQNQNAHQIPIDEEEPWEALNQDPWSRRMNGSMWLGIYVLSLMSCWTTFKAKNVVCFSNWFNNMIRNSSNTFTSIPYLSRTDLTFLRCFATIRVKSLIKVNN